MALESDEVVERRLQILTKIIECSGKLWTPTCPAQSTALQLLFALRRKPPKPDELQEIMKVPGHQRKVYLRPRLSGLSASRGFSCSRSSTWANPKPLNPKPLNALNP